MTERLKHDAALFEVLARCAEALRPGLRRGSMFGCPAIYCGKKLVACVYGDRIGLKVPEQVASRALSDKRAVAFRPYGKPAMREWIEISAENHDDLDPFYDLVTSALAFAEKNNGCGDGD